MLKVFIDSSVIVAACGSTSGSSALILGLSRTGKIRGLITAYSVNEAQKNVQQKMPPKNQLRLTSYLLKAKLVYVTPSNPQDIAQCSTITVTKDAPILAATLNSQANYLVTLDRKHLLTAEVKTFMHPIQVTTPGELVATLLHL